MKGIRKLACFIVFYFLCLVSLFAYQSCFKANFWAISLHQLGFSYGKQYHILEKDTLIGNDKCYIVHDYTNSVRLGIFKEDTVLQQVYIYDNNVWRVYYDFSLGINDRVLIRIANAPYFMQVYEIDSFTDCLGIRRKVLKLKGSGPAGNFLINWIEGVGSNQGIYYQYTNQYYMQYDLEYSFQGITKAYCQYKNCKNCPELPIILTIKNNCISDTIHFELDLIKQPLSVIDWDFGDTTNNASPFHNSLTALHKYSFADSFNVTVRLYDTLANKLTYFRKWITIWQPLYNSLPADTTLCSADKFILNPTPVVEGTNYHWFGDLNGSPNTTALTVYKSGTYILKHTAGTCPSTFDTVTVLLIPKKLVDLGSDRIGCEGEVARLSVREGYETLLWSTGDTIQTIDVSKSGNIWARASYSGCVLSDTVSIIFHSIPKFTAIKDTSLCLGDSILLIADTVGGNRVDWWDSEVNPARQFKSGGSYWINIYNSYCSATDTFNIEALQKPAINLGRDTTVCMPGPITLTANSPFSIAWSTGDTGNTVAVIPPATIWAKCYNKHCVVTDTIKVAYKATSNFDAGSVDWCFWEEPFIIDLVSHGLDNYSFTYSGLQHDTVFLPETVIRAIEDKDGCMVDYHLTVNALCDENIYIPTAFTPNSDGLNDFFQLQHPMLQSFHVTASIYNRYGELVYTSDQPDFMWDGTYKRINSQEGIYMVHMTIQMKNGKRSVYHGNLTLLR